MSKDATDGPRTQRPPAESATATEPGRGRSKRAPRDPSQPIRGDTQQSASAARTPSARAAGTRAQGERRYRAILELAPDAIVVADADGHITFSNRRVEELFGYSREQLLGEPVELLIHEQNYTAHQQQHYIRSMAALRAGPMGASLQCIGLRRDSSEFPVEVSLSPLPGKDGGKDVCVFIAVIRDITERKQIEQALQESEAHYRDLVESQTEMVCRYRPDGTLTFVNDAYCRHWGRAREELIGKQFPDLLFPAEAERARAGLTWLTQHPGVVTDEHEVTRPDGSVSWQQWVEHAVVDADGHVVELQAIGRDITARKQAEEALRQSEERYRAVVETQSEMISRFLPDTTLTFVNEATCRSAGKSREALLGTKFLEMLPDSARERVSAEIQSLLAHPGVATVEHEIRLPDGSLRWQQWVNRTILDEQGQVIELQGVGRDITARKQGMEARRQSEARFRAAFESATIGMMVVGTDGHPLQVNRPLAEMLGYSEEELYAVPFAKFTYPDDVEPNLTLFHQALAGEIESYQLEKRFLHKQGHIVWGHLSAGVVRDAAGQALYVVGHVEDITERKRLEREREEAKDAAERHADELDRIFEAVTDGLVVYGADGRAVRANAAIRRLLESDAVPSDAIDLPVGKWPSLYMVRAEDGRPLALEDLPVMRVLRGESLTGPDTMDIQVRTPEGREVSLSVSGAPLHDRAGRLVGAVCVYRDQTERKRLERERKEAQANELALREVNWRLDAFLAIASHDVRAPITVTVGTVETAQRLVERLVTALRTLAVQATEPLRLAALTDLVDWSSLLDLGERVQKSLAIADQSAGALGHLIALLFDTAQARAGRLELHRQPTALLALVREQVEALRLVAPRRQIKLELPTTPLRPILADADRIGQVLTNYLTNALKSSAEERPVEVRAEVNDSRLIVSVHDQGPGLPPEEQALVWQMYHRARGVEVRSQTVGWLGQGLGLGLHICKLIIEGHGGQVGVESQVGQGSRFWFSLPLAATAS